MELDDTDYPPDPTEFTDPSPSRDTDSTLSILCDFMQEHGLQRVLVRYAGSGDSGSVEAVEYDPPDRGLPTAFEDKLREVAENYCPDGYENGDGGYGTLLVYPNHALAELEHYDWYQDSAPMPSAAAALPGPLHAQLVALGAVTVTAEFNGYGDSGGIETLAVVPEEAVVDDGLRAELEALLLDCLPSGWENNGGGSGNCIVDVATGAVEVNGSWHVEQPSEACVTRWNWRT